MQSTVYIHKTDNFDYEIPRLRDSIRDGLDLVLGKDHFKNKTKVLIKPNLLMKSEPKEAITTHPHLIIALASVLKEKGTQVSVADNPGGFGKNPLIYEIYQALGLDAYPEVFTLLHNDKPPYLKNGVPFSWWTKGFDEIINVPKFKTHDLMSLTAAMKNIYGLIPGIKKSSLHRDYPKPSDLAKVIVDINKWFRPGVNILDGIVSLEGEGPAKRGIPLNRGLILFSNSAFALDWVLARLIKMDPLKIPYLRLVLQEKLIQPSDIKVYPEDWQKLAIDDFRSAPPALMESVPRFAQKRVASFLRFKPWINNRVCQMCEKCLESCPTSAIHVIQGERLSIDYNECIMCMCCQEVCPYGAVEIKYSLLFKLLKTLLNLKPRLKK